MLFGWFLSHEVSSAGKVADALFLDLCHHLMKGGHRIGGIHVGQAICKSTDTEGEVEETMAQSVRVGSTCAFDLAKDVRHWVFNIRVENEI